MMNLETKTEENEDATGDVKAFSSVKTTKLVCIEYPGFVKNVDKMLETIGGEQKLSDTYYNNKCRLQMTYRPEDLNAHVACADLVPCTGLLMKVGRRKKPGSKSGDYEYKQEIVGVVKEQYKFQTLMDYQYLTPQPLWNYFTKIHGSELSQQDFPPYFAPPTFGRIDTCGAYSYRPDPQLNRQPLISKEMTESFQSSTVESTAAVRKRRQTESMAALFDSKEVPQEPSPNAVNIIKKLMGADQVAIETVKELFEERPIWSKLAISCHIEVSLDRLKKILQYFAYYWLSGPWRTMWCKMAYDPRKDPKAKIYQMIDFRVRDSKESKKTFATLVPKRSYKNYIPRNLQSRVLPHGSSVLAAIEEPDEKGEEDLSPYIFTPTKMLPSRNMMYQLCDLHDPDIQQIIRENDGAETECNEKEGWFPGGTMNRIRAQLSKTVIAYFERERQKKKEALTEEAADNSAEDSENTLVLDSYDGDYSETHNATGFQPFRYLQMLQESEGEPEGEYNYDEEDDYYMQE